MTTPAEPARLRLLVTGGTGFLGRHIVGGPASRQWEVLAPGSESLDLRDGDQVRSAMRDLRPDAVIHTAYRRDDRASILDASRQVAEAAAEVGARLVHVSSDVVFRGRLEPYSERDLPSPVHDYGRAKADAEKAVARACPSAVIVRTSLIYGTDDLSLHEVAVRHAITGRSPMAFFTDEVRSPVLVDDLAAALVTLARRSEIVGALHLGGPRALSRADLAVLTARRHGWDASRLRFATLAESAQVRPGRVELDSSRARSLGLVVRGPAPMAGRADDERGGTLGSLGRAR